MSDLLPDEQHIANALYLLQKALALREVGGHCLPTIHACLRDAAEECENARQFWTKEETEDEAALRDRIFRAPPIKRVSHSGSTVVR